ncbi:MAG: alpha/beta hydrolase fold domain-containing protein [Planctomycetaceae bacterium]
MTKILVPQIQSDARKVLVRYMLFSSRQFALMMACACLPVFLTATAFSQQTIQQNRRSQSTAWAYPPELPDARAFTYKKVDTVELKAWVYEPEGSAKSARPCVVFFFGGGWRSGTPQQFQRQCEYLASRGVVAITCDYRVAARHNVKAVDCVEDAKSAIRWVRQNAQMLGVDSGQIAAAGGSAGGHIAACTGLLNAFDSAEEDKSISSKPNAMILFNPALMLAPMDGIDSGDWDEQKFADLELRMGVPGRELSPLHNVQANQPPTLILHGLEDNTVPIATIRPFVKAMTDAGNRCELAVYEGAGHGFFNVRNQPSTSGADSEKTDRQIQWNLRTMLRMDQFLTSLNWIEGPPTVPVVDRDSVSIRGSLAHSFRQFNHSKKGHVAFLGGSITEMNGFRPIVERWLTTQFPEAEFDFTNAGIASTCSHTGAFRLQRDVLSRGPVDLLIVEFAVNDDQDAHHSPENCLLGMEGILRHTRTHNPNADIVMVHFVNPDMLKQIQDGTEPLSSQQHERLARYYGISSVYVAREVARRISTNQLTWEQFGGTHPGPIGNQLAADLVAEVLTAGWSSIRAESKVFRQEDYEMPAKPLAEGCFDHGELVSHQDLDLGPGWKLEKPDWKRIPGSFRSRFAADEFCCSLIPGSQLKFRFRGDAVGAWVLAGPDAGQLQVRIDEEDWETIELFHHHSKGLHYPRTVLFGSQLGPGEHLVTVRIAEGAHPQSTGTAARILSFVANADLSE